MSNMPKTLREAMTMRYGPLKQNYDQYRCAMPVMVDRRRKGPQCLHRNGLGPDGLYCLRHAKIVESQP